MTQPNSVARSSFLSQETQGLDHRRNAGILAVVGLFLAGPLFGALALWQASKASKFGIRSTGWQILAVIDILAGVIVSIAMFSVMSSGMS